MEIIESDVVIIGGGPAGCTCALYTSRSNLKTVILDKNPSVGALAITHQMLKLSRFMLQVIVEIVVPIL